jgi:hypothetical protein
VKYKKYSTDNLSDSQALTTKVSPGVPKKQDMFPHPVNSLIGLLFGGAEVTNSNFEGAQ